jgi:squalene cyclase
MEKQRSTGLRWAIDRALDYLLAARSAEGLWSDFHLYPGISDEWVTAYVATLLASTGDGPGAEAANSAWRQLQARQRPDGRWGYNIRTIGDGDSTAWGVRLATAVGAAGGANIALARQALNEHMRPNGGVATYATEGPIRRLIEAPDDLSFRGWCGAHTCVTAVVAALPELAEPTRAYLRGAQQEDGSWKSYWWCDHEYATTWAAEALACGHEAADRVRVQLAVRWAARRLRPYGFVATGDQPTGSPFATALCLRTLLLTEEPSEVHQQVSDAAAWLFFRQRTDGSWSESARLRVPWPDETEPDLREEWIYGGRKEGSLIFDHRRAFTTVTVLSALHRVSNYQDAQRC